MCTDFRVFRGEPAAGDGHKSRRHVDMRTGAIPAHAKVAEDAGKLVNSPQTTLLNRQVAFDTRVSPQNARAYEP